MFRTDLKDSEFWPTWRLLRTLTLRQAALLLGGQDPATAESTEAEVPSNVIAISKALLEAANAGVLPVGMERDGKGSYMHQRDLGDPLTYEATSSDLAIWAQSNFIPHHWISPNGYAAIVPDVDYPPQLRIAIAAYNAVRHAPLNGMSPKGALLDWVSKEHPELSSMVRERIAVIANWKKGGPRMAAGVSRVGPSNDS